jgi:L-lactate dehydrogenase complex protein LldG
MNEDSRAAIYAGIRRANRNRGVDADTIRQQLESFGDAPVAALPRPDIAEAFLLNVLNNQGTVDCANDKTAAVKAIAGFLFDHCRTQKLVVGADPRLAALPWRDGRLLPRFEPAEDGDLAALSYARLGVAETGSIITYSGRANPARNNLLPQTHLVLVDRQDLVTTLEQAWVRIEQDSKRFGRPRGINMISAPSSTADIEFQLVKGAHGPRSWHVILVGQGTEKARENLHQGAV